VVRLVESLEVWAVWVAVVEGTTREKLEDGFVVVLRVKGCGHRQR